MPEIVVITGGTQGVGRVFARRFARSGAKVAVLGRGLDELRETAVELATRGASVALVIPCDIRDPEQVDRAAARIERELGPIDVWIDADTEPATARRRTLWLGIATAAVVVVAVFAVAKVLRR